MNIHREQLTLPQKFLTAWGEFEALKGDAERLLSLEERRKVAVGLRPYLDGMTVLPLDVKIKTGATLKASSEGDRRERVKRYMRAQSHEFIVESPVFCEGRDSQINLNLTESKDIEGYGFSGLLDIMQPEVDVRVREQYVELARSYGETPQDIILLQPDQYIECVAFNPDSGESTLQRKRIAGAGARLRMAEVGIDEHGPFAAGELQEGDSRELVAAKLYLSNLAVHGLSSQGYQPELERATVA